MWYAFAATDYSAARHRQAKLNVLNAATDAMNPSDLIMGIVRAAKLALGRDAPPSRNAYSPESMNVKYESIGLNSRENAEMGNPYVGGGMEPVPPPPRY